LERTTSKVPSSTGEHKEDTKKEINLLTKILVMKKLPVTLRGIQRSLHKLMQIKWILLLMPDNTILSGDFSSIETDTALQESLIIKLNVT
jgi:hypothetical protein